MSTSSLLFFLLVLFDALAAGKCICLFNKVTPTITSIGRPPQIFKVSWINKFRGRVTFNVHFNVTSEVNHCENPTKEALYIAQHCRHNSSKFGLRHECDITKDVKGLHMDYKMESLCVMISAISLSSPNRTCYSLFNECTPALQSTCPAPNLRVFAEKEKSLSIFWDAPKYVNNETLRTGITFIISYRLLSSLNSSSLEESILINTSKRRFTWMNNSYEIHGLGVFQKYQLKICCTFQYSEKTCASLPFTGTTILTSQEEPSRAPQITDYRINKDNNQAFLVITWEPPPRPTWNGYIVQYQILHWQNSNDTCKKVSKDSALLNITNITATQAGIPVAWHTHCFKMRMCTLPGCGPWSTVHSTLAISTDKPTTLSSLQNDTPKIITGIIVAFCVIAIILVIVNCVVKRRRNPQTSLTNEVGELERSTSTVELEDLCQQDGDGDYAEIVSNLL